jgi:thiol-disulfide isomerase/thioredoxin
MAMSYQAYIELLGKNLDLHKLHYKKFFINEAINTIISGYRKVNILIITEPWCGDSLALIPIMRKIAAKNGHWEIKVLLRDSNPEIMDQFLTKGVRGIPIFLFIDEKGELIFHWGPRPKKAAQIFESQRELIRKEEIEKQDVIKKIRVYYAKDRGIDTLAELIQVFDKHGL